MTKHEHVLSNYRQPHIREKIVIGENSATRTGSCNDIIIKKAKFGDALHVRGVEPILLSIYCITHTNEKVKV